MMRGTAVEHSDEYLCTGGAYHRHIVELVSKRAPSGSVVPFVLVENRKPAAVFVIVVGGRHVNDKILLSVTFYVAKLITDLALETDSDWSRWTLQELE